jgi:hypothetical protein
MITAKQKCRTGLIFSSEIAADSRQSLGIDRIVIIDKVVYQKNTLDLAKC